MEVKSKANKDLATFDLSLLRWNKVIICTDADVDGFQIRTLILTMLYRLTPTLIEEGLVFIAETPLYEINTKTDTYFACLLYTSRWFPRGKQEPPCWSWSCHAAGISPSTPPC